MAKAIYQSEYITLLNNKTIYVTPLKIKYLRLFMDEFSTIKEASSDYDAMQKLAQCVAIGMQQYCPELATVEGVEDSMDLNTMYRMLELSADIKINSEKAQESAMEAMSDAKTETWDTFDLPKLESELFLLGIWKDYEDLEQSLSMPELIATLSAKRDLDYNEKKFLASIQGVDLDKASSQEQGKEDPWERIKARAAARARGEDPDTIPSADPNDITSFTGIKAQQAGFGIGMGIDYTQM